MPMLVVQMGHAGRTTGATGAPGEQAYTQAVGAECARLLAGRDGWQVRLIPADPSSAAYRGDAFFAIHADGNTNPLIRGASLGWQNQAGRALSNDWRAYYTRRGFTGPWHPDNYTANLAGYYGVGAAIRQGNTRACIVECGTITNTDDRKIMLPEWVALAIGDTLGITQPPPQEDDMTPDQDTVLSIAAHRVNAMANMLDKTDPNAPYNPNEPIELVTTIKALQGSVAELHALITDLVGAGVTLRASGEIVVKGDPA